MNLYNGCYRQSEIPTNLIVKELVFNYLNDIDELKVDTGITVTPKFGGVERRLSDKLSDTISVKDFGAVGDGVTDDTTAFELLEANVTGQIIDLQGKTYNVTTTYSRNKYTNGYFKVNNSVINSETPSDKKIAYRVNCGNGQKVGELLTTLGGDSDTGRTIIQGAALFVDDSSLYTMRTWSGSGSTATSVIEKYRFGAGIREASFTSQPLNFLGHQSLGLTREQAQLYFWGTVDGIKSATQAQYIVKFSLDESTGLATSVKYFRVFNDLYRKTGYRCLSVSPDYKTLAVTNTTTEGLFVVKVFNTTDFIDENTDYSEKCIYEFPFRNYGKPVQSIATDGKHVYILHGSKLVTEPNFIEVYTLDGKLVATDFNCRIAVGDANAATYNFYEPEVLFFNNSGGVWDLQFITALAKKGGAGTSTPHTNIISTSNYTQPTSIRMFDAGTPAIFLEALHDIAMPEGHTLSIAKLNPSGVCTDLAQITDDTLKVVGQTTSGNTRVLVEAKSTAQAQIRLTNSNRDGMLQVSSSGNLGIYDITNGRWVIYVSSSNATYVTYSNGVFDTSGAGSPEGVINASVGSTYRRTDGGAGSSFYVKESGTGNTGWVAK